VPTPVPTSEQAAQRPRLGDVATPGDWVKQCPYCYAEVRFTPWPRVDTQSKGGSQRLWHAAACPA